MTFPAEFSIAGRTVGADHPPYVIAEIGSNHDGSLERAVALIEASAQAGADAVKFQSFTAETLAAPSAERLVNFFRANALPAAWYPSLAAAAARVGVHFTSTPFHLGAVDDLVGARVPFLKIASGDLTNVPLLRRAAGTGLPIVVSSGAARLGDVERSLAALRGAGAAAVVVLHCVSAYPPVYEEMNVRAMATIASAFGVPVGISDHTPGSAVPAAAVALGAVVIEKHITDDRARSGPDHPYALTVPEFADLVRTARIVHASLGDGMKGPTPSDEGERYWAWRGLYADGALAAGTVVGPEHLIALRPREGVGADEIDDVVGRRLRVALAPGDPVRWEHLDPKG